MSDQTPDAAGFVHPAPPVPTAPWMPPTPAAPSSAPYGAGTSNPGYAPPQGYAAPVAPPQGHAAPYVMPSAPQYGQGIGMPTPPPAQSGRLGLTALIIAVVAAVVTPVLAAIAAFGIGEVLARNGASQLNNPDFLGDLSLLAGAREWVLLGEIAFWAGTALGIWAIVQGIIAVVKRRGFGTGIAAIVVAAMAPMAFFFTAYLMVFIGLAAGIVPLTQLNS